MPSAWTSVAVVTTPPVSCSGAANSGVKARPPSRVSADASARSLVLLEELGDPEVEELDLAVPGRRARWTA